MRLEHIVPIYSSRILKSITLNCLRNVQHCGEDILPWRGYIATWKIESGMLYLIGIYANVTGVKGHIKGNESTIQSLLSDEAVGMDYFFPNQSQVLADWYSGDLPIHNENTANRESNYLIFDIDKGHIIGQEQVTEQEYYNHSTYK